VKQATLDLRILSSSPTLGTELALKRKEKEKTDPHKIHPTFWAEVQKQFNGENIAFSTRDARGTGHS